MNQTEPKLIKTEEEPIQPNSESVVVYHDEIKDSKDNPVAHGFLIVPVRSFNILLNDLLYYKEKYHIPESRLHWQKFSGTKLSLEMKCARDWLNCLIGGMANERYIKHESMERHTATLGLRFCAIFMDSLDELSDDFWQWCGSGERTVKKFETLLRIGLKGGLHFLYNEDYRVGVKEFYTDAGAFHRKLDSGRIVDRLRYEVNPYIRLEDHLHIASAESDHKKAQSGKDTVTAHFLQLCDVALGATSFVCLKHDHKTKWVIARGLKNLLDKRKRGFSGFSQSRHFKTFTITKAEIRGGVWNFEPLKTAKAYGVLEKYKLPL